MKSDYSYAVYIMANSKRTLYTGMTNNLFERVWEHKQHTNPTSFTARYQIHDLVYYEEFQYAGDAVAREIQLKGGSRKKKIDLIESMNPDWNDLAADWYDTSETNSRD